MTRQTDLVRHTKATSVLAPTQVIMTMTDQTHCLGGVLSICFENNYPLLFVANGPSGVGFLTTPDSQALAMQILSGGAR